MSYNKKIMEAMQKVTTTTLIEEGKMDVAQENFKYGSRSTTNDSIFEAYTSVCEGDNKYQDFVKAQLGDRSLADMSDEEKKKFFADIDKKWTAKDEKNTSE